MNLKPRGRLTVAGVAVLIVISGSACSASVSEPSAPSSGSPAPVPSFGAEAVTLASLGFSNGPAERVALPAGVRLTERIDQPNVVTVLAVEPPASEFVGFLATSLPEAGFEVSAASETGIVFSGFGWDGGVTGGEVSALTLRRQA